MGLGIPNLQTTVAHNYASSCKLMDPLTLLITNGMELVVHAYTKTCAGARKMQQKWKAQAATSQLKLLSMAA